MKWQTTRELTKSDAWLYLILFHFNFLFLASTRDLIYKEPPPPSPLSALVPRSFFSSPSLVLHPRVTGSFVHRECFEGIVTDCTRASKMGCSWRQALWMGVERHDKQLRPGGHAQ
ncbi:hypothetical protein V8C40DRAFT_42513 [Trichoderma camerunense]